MFVVAPWEVLHAAVSFSAKVGGSASPGPDGSVGWRFVRQKCSSLEKKNVKTNLKS